MDINKYIKELLLTKDSVVVPGFGAFEKITISASIDEETGEITPPHSSVAFNSDIKNGSGVLIKHISEKETLPEDKVTEEVKKQVDTWNENLNSGKNVIVAGIGLIHKDSEGKVEFQSNIKPEELPDSYGLPTIKVVEKSAAAKQTNTTTKNDRKKPIKKKPEKKKAPVKKKPLVKKTVKAKETKQKDSTGKKSNKKLIIGLAIGLPIAALIVLGIIFSDFVGEKLEGTFIADLFNKEEVKDTSDIVINIDTIATKDSSELFTEAILENVTIVSSESNERIEPKLDKLKDVKKVHIIAGSFTKKRNAQKHRNKLNRKGFNSTVLPVNKKGLYRVAISSFENVEDAAKDFERIKGIDENLSLWILADY